jgi:hypothetical protein
VDPAGGLALDELRLTLSAGLAHPWGRTLARAATSMSTTATTVALGRRLVARTRMTQPHAVLDLREPSTRQGTCASARSRSSLAHASHVRTGGSIDPPRSRDNAAS